MPAIHGSNRTAYFALNAQNGNGSAFGFRFGEPRTAEDCGAIPFTPDIIAGAGDDMDFSGQTRYLEVVGSVIDDLGPGPSMGRTITVIAGGR